MYYIVLYECTKREIDEKKRSRPQSHSTQTGVWTQHAVWLLTHQGIAFPLGHELFICVRPCSYLDLQCCKGRCNNNVRTRRAISLHQLHRSVCQLEEDYLSSLHARQLLLLPSSLPTILSSIFYHHQPPIRSSIGTSYHITPRLQVPKQAVILQFEIYINFWMCKKPVINYKTGGIL